MWTTPEPFSPIEPLGSPPPDSPLRRRYLLGYEPKVWARSGLFASMVIATALCCSLLALALLWKWPAHQTVVAESNNPQEDKPQDVVRPRLPPISISIPPLMHEAKEVRIPSEPKTPPVIEQPSPEAPRTDPPLRYTWETGSAYEYKFTIEATVGDAKPTVHGLVSYEPTKESPASVDPDSFEDEILGTGFVVSPKGVLVTCAHVVQGAVNIRAHFLHGDCSAEVIAFDPEHDLALLQLNAADMPQIGATDMPCLPVSDSDRVQPGETIRVVGFLSSKILGDNIGLTHGSIAEVIDKQGSTTIRIDSGFHPDKSGGPLVDREGRIVGVASALLAGESVERMGFAVPSNDALALLAENRIATKRGDLGLNLDAPELIHRVESAVALLKIRLGPGGVGLLDQKVVKFDGHYTIETTRQQGQAMPVRNENETGKMVVDSKGEITSYQGSLEMPLMFQVLGKLGIESLPVDGRRSWRTRRPVVVVQQQPTSPSDSADICFHSRFAVPWTPYHRHPLQVRQPERIARVIPALEEVCYQMQPELSNGTVVIEKRYDLSTLHQSGQATFLDVTGSGKTVWNKKLGVPGNSHFSAGMTLSDGRSTLQIPITMACALEHKAARASSNGTAE
jgi:S1-C subfamily serine protease